MVRFSLLAVGALALTALVTPTASAQFGRGLQIPPAMLNLMLMRGEAVQKELDLNDEQKKAVGDLASQMISQAMEIMSGLQDLTDEERKEELPNVMKMVNEKGKELQGKVDKVLNPKQAVRMKELSIQRRDAGALQDDEVIDALKLSDDQKKQLADVRDAAAKKQEEVMKTIFSAGGGGVDRAAIGKQMQALQKELGEKILAVLTSQQREQFEKMKGEKFEFPQTRGLGF